MPIEAGRSLRPVHKLISIGLATLTTLLLFTATSPSPASGSQAERDNLPMGLASTANTQDQPVATCPTGGQCFADVPGDNPFYILINRIYQQGLVAGYPCGGPDEPCDSQNRPYYRPSNIVTRQQMAKFIDNARRLPGIDMQVSAGFAPISARNDTDTAIAAYSTNGQALSAQSQTSSAIYAQTGNAPAISALSTSGTNGIGVQGEGYTGVEGSGQQGVKGTTDSSTGTGVTGENSGGGDGVYGSAISDGSGVSGESDNGIGVYGKSSNAFGVFGDSTGGNGVYGSSSGGDGVYGGSESGIGVHGFSNSNYAGEFDGNVHITGNCCEASSGTYKIDDPLDPANRYLNQSAVESPNMTDMLDGNITTDAEGDATVQLPAYFEALNSDFRYQLTVIGQFSQAIVSSKIANNTFSIKTDKPRIEVSWQVTGVRHDPYAQAHPIQPEQEKPINEQGKYLHPTELGQPASLGIGYDDRQKVQQSIPERP